MLSNRRTVGDRQAAAELTDTYGSQPQFRGLSVNDQDSYEVTPEYVTE
jgi:hypothetical protein